MATTVFDLLARVSADVSPFNTAFDSTSDSVESSLSSIYQSARRWLGAGGVAGTFYAATAAANEFNQIIADISVITELQIKKIEKSLLQLDNVFGRPSNTASTFYETISSGVRGTTDDVANYVKAVGKAATTIRADIENTGNVMTTLTNAYDLSIQDTQKLVDFLYLTVREGKAHGDELARTLGLVINNAAETGVSLNELGAAIAILSRTQSASQSMIGLNQMLNSLIKPTLQAAAEARKWNIELGASALQAKGFTATLQELHDKVGGNVEALEKMFGNIRAGRAVLSLTGRQFDNFMTTLREFELGAGTGEEAFTKQIDTAYKDLVRLRAQTEKTLIQIGSDIEPVTRSVYGLAEAVMKGFGDTKPLSRYATYIYIVVTALRALKKELYDIRAAIHNVATGATGAASSAQSAAASRSGAPSANAAIAATARDAAVKAERNSLNRKLQSAGRGVRSSFRGLLSAGEKAQAASDNLLDVQMQRRLAQESNASLREQTRLRNLENRYAKRFITTHNRLDAATKQLAISRNRLTQLNQQKAMLDSGDLNQYAKAYGVRFPHDPNSMASRVGKKFSVTNTLSEITGTGGLLSKIGNGILSAVAAWSVADIGYNIGKAIAERFNFTDSGFIKSIVNAFYGIDTDKQETENAQHNVTALRRQANTRVDSLKMANEITSYEAENLKAEIATAKTKEQLQETISRLNKSYGEELDRRTVRTQSIENAQRGYQDSLEGLAKFQREKFDDNAIVGARSTAFYSAIDRLASAYDVSLAQKRGSSISRLHSLTPEVQREFGAYPELAAVDEFVNAGGVSSQIDTIKRMLADATRSGDYSELNKLLNVQDVAALRDADIAKGLSDIQTNILFNVISSLNSQIQKVNSTETEAVRTQRFKEAQRKVASALSNLIGVNLNFYIEDLEKAHKLNKEYVGEPRARYLLQNRDVSRVEDLTSRLEYESEMMTRHEEFLSAIVTAYDKVKDRLEAGARDKIVGAIDNAGKQLAAAREKVQKASSVYIESVVEDITAYAEQQFYRTGLDTSRVSYTLLVARQNMQKTVLDGLQDEIEYVEKQLSNGVRGSQASILQRQLQELIKQRNTASEKYFNAINEAEEYRLQQLEKEQNAGLISGAAYEAGVRRVHGGRVSRANQEVAQFEQRYRESPTVESFFRLQQATENLKNAQTDAALATKGFGAAQREVQNAMLNQIQQFASNKDAKGRLTQDALYHSLNLMTRLMGPRASFALTQSPSVETRGIPNYKNAQSAQSAVARTLDAYVRSQEYAQASTGKTVLDIYNFMKTNNTIVVKGQ
jgi:TP901 family phage tail tape measure protein